jgi:uncharacterized protein YaiE (UPF0345 family)
MSDVPSTIPGVTAVTKANVYFGGKVVSHTLRLAGGGRKTLGLIFPGTYHFDTEAAEVMEIVAGACVVTVDGGAEVAEFEAGSTFTLPGKSGFTIEVRDSICEYICTFLD